MRRHKKSQVQIPHLIFTTVFDLPQNGIGPRTVFEKRGIVKSVHRRQAGSTAIANGDSNQSVSGEVIDLKCVKTATPKPPGIALPIDRRLSFQSPRLMRLKIDMLLVIGQERPPTISRERYAAIPALRGIRTDFRRQLGSTTRIAGWTCVNRQIARTLAGGKPCRLSPSIERLGIASGIRAVWPGRRLRAVVHDKVLKDLFFTLGRC
jgi:hypothetical protein